ncbi:hypothetical protein BBJ28_00003511 [Nothophytophthora sp. Chile5]|nr:hypothetical protein BBJ28_00003511 [Nothophytophthora sp. Chile5]
MEQVSVFWLDEVGPGDSDPESEGRPTAELASNVPMLLHQGESPIGTQDAERGAFQASGNAGGEEEENEDVEEEEEGLEEDDDDAEDDPPPQSPEVALHHEDVPSFSKETGQRK